MCRPLMVPPPRPVRATAIDSSTDAICSDIAGMRQVQRFTELSSERMDGPNRLSPVHTKISSSPYPRVAHRARENR